MPAAVPVTLLPSAAPLLAFTHSPLSDVHATPSTRVPPTRAVADRVDDTPYDRPSTVIDIAPLAAVFWRIELDTTTPMSKLTAAVSDVRTELGATVTRVADPSVHPRQPFTATALLDTHGVHPLSV